MRASSHRRTGYHAVAHSRQRGLFTGSISVLLLTFLFPRASIRLGMRDQILLSRRFVLLAHQGLKSFACAFSFPSAELQAEQSA